MTARERKPIVFAENAPRALIVERALHVVQATLKILDQSLVMPSVDGRWITITTSATPKDERLVTMILGEKTTIRISCSAGTVTSDHPHTEADVADDPEGLVRRELAILANVLEATVDARSCHRPFTIRSDKAKARIAKRLEELSIRRMASLGTTETSTNAPAPWDCLPDPTTDAHDAIESERRAMRSAVELRYIKDDRDAREWRVRMVAVGCDATLPDDPMAAMRVLSGVRRRSKRNSATR
jgi:hypothetical protein